MSDTQEPSEQAKWLRKRATTPSTDHPADSRQFAAIADLIESQESELRTAMQLLKDIHGDQVSRSGNGFDSSLWDRLCDALRAPGGQK